MTSMIAAITGGERRRRRLSSGFDPALCGLIEHPNVINYPNPLPGRPAYLEPYVDSVYGTTVTRIGGNAGTAIGSTGQNWQLINRHRYSKEPVWNADMSMMTLKRVRTSQAGGNLEWIFLDGNTYEPLFARDPSGGGGLEWHPTNPNVFLQVTGGGILRTWNPVTNVYTTLHTLSGYSNCTIGGHEGNPSHDGDWVAVLATRTSDSKTVCFAVRLSTQTKYPDLDLAALGYETVDWCSISPLANYIVVNGKITGGSGVGDHTKVFDLEGNQIGSAWLSYGHPSHYDLAVNDVGEEVAVGENKSAPNEGRVIMRRLSNGTEVVLNDGGYATHTSARCINMPGWALVSHQGDLNASWPPYRDEIFLVKLSTSKKVLRLCHVFAEFGGYFREAHASISPDGKRMIFASNWKSGTDSIHSYVCDIRPICGL